MFVLNSSVSWCEVSVRYEAKNLRSRLYLLGKRSDLPNTPPQERVPGLSPADREIQNGRQMKTTFYESIK